jgi:hypothetical protein
MAHPGREIDFIRSLGLPIADEQAILGGTLAAIFGLTETPATPSAPERTEVGR